MRRRSFLVSLLAAPSSGLFTALDASNVPHNTHDNPVPSIWPRPIILPLPFSTTGIKAPIVSLGGTWKINLDPPQDFWKADPIGPDWHDIVVPGQADKQGFPVKLDRMYVYRKTFTVPADVGPNRVFLRFEGVTGSAQPWINLRRSIAHLGVDDNGPALRYFRHAMPTAIYWPGTFCASSSTVSFFGIGGFMFICL